jgi:hypothetical protein
LAAQASPKQSDEITSHPLPFCPARVRWRLTCHAARAKMIHANTNTSFCPKTTSSAMIGLSASVAASANFVVAPLASRVASSTAKP